MYRSACANRRITVQYLRSFLSIAVPAWRDLVSIVMSLKYKTGKTPQFRLEIYTGEQR